MPSNINLVIKYKIKKKSISDRPTLIFFQHVTVNTHNFFLALWRITATACPQWFASIFKRMTFWHCLSGLQEHRYAYILTVHTEEYPKFILASIILDVLHPIPNNQLEFQLVSTFVFICLQRWSDTKSWTLSRSWNQEINDLRFKISLFILIHA